METLGLESIFHNEVQWQKTLPGHYNPVLPLCKSICSRPKDVAQWHNISIFSASSFRLGP
jgi:hypothetical protein